MSRKEDVLFCKIAITSGLVSEQQAQKVLSICNKREADEGRRPLIGAVFSKYNLMQSQEVQKVYEAVNKRTGGTAGTGAHRATHSKRGGGSRGGIAARRSAKGGRGGGGGSKQVDPQTLWMGIGFGVVFLIVVVIMIVLLVQPSTEEVNKASASSDTSESSFESTGSSSGTSSTAKKKKAERTTGPRPLSKEDQGKIRQALIDARLDIGENPERGLKMITDLRTGLKKKESEGYDGIAEYFKQCDDVEKQLKDAMSGADAGDTPEEPAVDPVEVPAKEPAKEPAAAEKSEPKKGDGDGFDFDF